MLYNIVLVSAIQQQESAMVYICFFPLEPPSHLLSHPIPRLWIVTEHWVELPVSYSKFLVIFLNKGFNKTLDFTLSFE